MTWPIVMHINYCEQGQSLDEACGKAVAWGYDGIEFRSGNIREEEPAERYLDRVERAVRRSGLQHVMFGSPGPNLSAGDAETKAGEAARQIRFYELAAERFPLTVCNAVSGTLLNPVSSVPYQQYEMHGSFTATSDQWTWAVEGFRAIGAAAERLGFKLAFETHMCYLHDLPEATAKLVDRIGHAAVGVNLDYGNYVYFANPASIQDTVAGLGSRLYYVHLKNSVALPGGGRMATALSEGEINHRHYLQALKQHRYEGPICLEAPRSGDREWYARQDIAYIRELMKDIGEP